MSSGEKLLLINTNHILEVSLMFTNTQRRSVCMVGAKNKQLNCNYVQHVQWETYTWISKTFLCQNKCILGCTFHKCLVDCHITRFSAYMLVEAWRNTGESKSCQLFPTEAPRAEQQFNKLACQKTTGYILVEENNLPALGRAFQTEKCFSPET